MKSEAFRTVFCFYVLLLFACVSTKTQAIKDNIVCTSSTVSKIEFVNSPEYKRLLEFEEKVRSTDKSETLIYREFPNGGMEDEIYSYIISMNEEYLEVSVYQGYKFNLISKKRLENENKEKVTSLIEQLKQSISIRNCECDGGTDGLVVYKKENLPFLGLIFKCMSPRDWKSRTSEEEIISKIIEYIV